MLRQARFAAALWLMLCASTAMAQSAGANGESCSLTHASGASPQRLTSRQRPRTYRLFIPPGYDGRQRLPLVLNLHGSGDSAENQAAYTGLESLAAAERFLVARELGGSQHVPAERRARRSARSALDVTL